jgi:hypothetical protein
MLLLLVWPGWLLLGVACRRTSAPELLLLWRLRRLGATRGWWSTWLWLPPACMLLLLLWELWQLYRQLWLLLLLLGQLL